MTTPRDIPLTINVLADNGQGSDLDTDGTLDASSVQLVLQPSFGTLVPQGGGTFRYTPGLLYTGVDSFTYKVADDRGKFSNVATVTITIESANLPPLARDDTVVMDVNKTVTFNVLGQNGSGVDRDLDGSLRPDFRGQRELASRGNSD